MNKTQRAQIEKLPRKQIEDAALMYFIPAAVAAAFVLKESAGDPYAVRFEAGWKYQKDVVKHAKANGISQATEKVCQMMSWGLMQIMGTVAREHGYTGPLSRLVEIEPNLQISCKKLSSVFKKYPLLDDAVSAYNDGTPVRLKNGKYANQEYVDRWHEHYANVQEVWGRNDVVLVSQAAAAKRRSKA